jgi:hypothetical protein
MSLDPALSASTEAARPSRQTTSADFLGTTVLRPQSQKPAPKYSIPARDLGAVEIPAVVENVDRAVKAFGRVPSLRHVGLTSTSTWLPPY